jgi:hypothetical protein
MIESLLPDIVTVIEKGWSLYRYLKERRIRELISDDQSRRVMKLYDFLRVLYYDQHVLRGSNGYFPVGVLPVSPSVVRQPDEIVGNLVPLTKEPPVFEPRIIEAIKRRGSEIWNGNTFSLAKLVLDKKMRANRVDAYIGSYFNMVSSADYLEYELLAAIEKGHALDLSNLPVRSAALMGFESPSDCLLSVVMGLAVHPGA